MRARTIRCSTPRGITAPGHRDDDAAPDRAVEVLNASRHHRPGSPPTLRRLRRTQSRAQRLAASPPRVTSWRCCAPTPARRVLNASRHHRPGSRREPELVPRDDDVLNASRHHRPGSHLAQPRDLLSRVVLNASRHHRPGSLGERPRAVYRLPVLNASRHHRPGSPLAGRTETATVRCSTPRGITAPGHRARRQDGWVSRVVCSTPRGITAPGHMTPMLPTAPSAVTCSTPRGITAPGHIVRARCSVVPEMCSTPRGITAPGHRAWCCQRARPHSAQRLAASPPRVTCGSRRAWWSVRVLNASRHHRPGSQEAQATGNAPEQCSTPRGITAPGHARSRPRSSRVCTCAQRLAASPPRVTFVLYNGIPVLQGAQRLAASPPRVTGGRGRFPLIPRAVLNASRHHRPGSPPGSAFATQARIGAQRLAASPPRVTTAAS